MLVEGDDFHEPIADAVKGVTDGQLWLSRSLASKGHFPAIEVLDSISRVREEVSEEIHVKRATRVLSLLATYREIEDLVNLGAFVAGANPELDLAVQARPKIVTFLRQEAGSMVSLDDSRRELAELSRWIEQAERKLASSKK